MTPVRRGWWRLFLVAFLVDVVSLFSTGAAEAAWTAGGNGNAAARAAVLQPPTSPAVTQACLPDAMPARRSGAGGYSFTAGRTGSTNLTIAQPSGAVAGDVLVAGISWRGNHTSYSPSAPPGWSLVHRTGDDTIAQFVYYRVVTASEPSSHTWTGLDANKVGGIAAYTGVDTTAPVNASAGQINSTTGSITAPSVTTTRANAVLVGVFGVVGEPTITAPSGMSGIWSGSSTGAGTSSFQITAMAADEAWPTAGATGVRTATYTGGARSIGQLIALQPPLRPRATTTWTTSLSAYATGQVFRRSAGANLQRQATLSASTTNQTDGPLASGTEYRVEVTATRSNWVSAAAGVTFTARSC